MQQHNTTPVPTQYARPFKLRFGPSGVHAFNRRTGINVLLDEFPVPSEHWHLAPRQVSVALTNACDLDCEFCYAPKTPSSLSVKNVLTWATELDKHGCFGVGFGGGEPTLHKSFVEICQEVAARTRLALTFTTHAHRINSSLIEALMGSVHFIRVSVDGVGATYEAIRGRPFAAVMSKLSLIRSLAPFGVNCVINAQTVDDLDSLAHVAMEVGAIELLLLPERAVRRRTGIDQTTLRKLRAWVLKYEGPLQLTVSESADPEIPTCNPTAKEVGLAAYAHVDASGVLRPNSYTEIGIRIEEAGILAALRRLHDGAGGVAK